MKKLAIITAWITENIETYKGKTNADIEKEILKGMPPIPYISRIEKVTVLDTR